MKGHILQQRMCVNGRVPDHRVHLSYHKHIHPEAVDQIECWNGLLKIQIRQQFRDETLQVRERPQMQQANSWCMMLHPNS